MNSKLIIMVACAALLSGPVGVYAGCTFESTDGGGDWNDADTWDIVNGTECGNYPGADDTAVITPSNNVTVNIDAECDVLTVQGNALLNVEGGTSKSLTIGSNSTCNGTIDGIDAQQGVIKPAASSTPTLTLTGASPGDDPVIRGNLEIEIKLVNNGRVIAGTSKTIDLTEEDKSGSGEWKADGGDLIVDVSVTGSATWRLLGGTIKFTHATASLTGSVIVSGGKFIADESFSTSGNLTFSGGEIQGPSTGWCMFSAGVCGGE